MKFVESKPVLICDRCQMVAIAASAQLSRYDNAGISDCAARRRACMRRVDGMEAQRNAPVLGPGNRCRFFVVKKADYDAFGGVPRS